MEPVLFAILTWGSSGSTWLAKLLNAHPEVFCAHSLGRHAQWQEAHRGRYVPNVGSAFSAPNAIAYYRWLATQAATAAGEAHGIPFEVWRAVEVTLADHEPRAAVLVRHPIPRIASHIALHEASLQTKLRGLDPPYADVHDLAEQLGLGLPADDYGSLAFVQGCHRASTTTLRQVRSSYPTFRLEDLSTDPEAPAGMLEHISAGRLDTFPEQIVEQAQASRLGRHRADTASEDPGEIYDAWTPWARDVFDMFFDDEVRRAAEQLGYELPPPRATTRLRPTPRPQHRNWRRALGATVRDVRRARRTHGTARAALSVLGQRLRRRRL